jgi:co-chaperonin GroES (HSP10)
MNIRPLADRVLLKAVAPIMDSQSGIYIPESAQKERPFMYEVISV